MTFSEDKFCPIIYTALKNLKAKCIREKCEWYGHGCPAYPTELEIDIYKADKEFYKELEERDAKPD